MSFPSPLDVTVELAFGADPDGDPTGWSFTDVTADLKSEGVQVTRGRSDESARVRPSTCSFSLGNDSGDYTPGLATSQHYPHVRLNVPVRVTVTYSAVDRRRFSGFVSEWRPEWPSGDLSTPSDDGYAVVRVSADGLLRRLTQGERSLRSPLHRAISRHPQVVAYWPCEDGSDATMASSPIDGVAAMVPSANVDFGRSADGLPGASSVMLIGEDSRNVLGRVPNHTPGDVYQISEAWRIEETPTAARAVMDVRTTSAGLARWQLRLSDSVFQVRAWDADDTEIVNETETLNTAAVGRWVRPVLQLEQRGSDVYWSAVIYTIDSSQTILHRLDAGLSTITADLGRVTRAGVNGPGMFQDRFAGHITVATGDAVDDPWLGALHPAPMVGTVRNSFPSPGFGRSPRGLAWDGAALRNADTDTDVVYRIDPVDGTFLDSFVSPTSDPLGLTFDGTHLRLVDGGTNEILRVDPSTGSVADSISTPDTAPLGLTWDGEALWLADDPAGTIYRLNPSDGSVLDSITGPSSSHRDLAWDGEALWAINSDGTTVYRLDPSDGSVLDSFDWEPGDAQGLTWDGISLWLASEHAFPDVSQFYRLTVLVEYSAADGFRGEPAAFRFQRLCQEEGISVEIVGEALDSMPMGPQQIAALTDNLAECADTDAGIMGEQLDGFGLFYRTRTTLYNQDAVLTLAANPASGTPQLAPPFRPVEDDQRARNDVTASRPFGTSARAVDSDHIDDHGRYDTSVTVNPSSDEALEQIAYWRLHLGTTEGMRYPQVSPALTRDPDLIPDWSALREGDVIRVTDLPPQHPAGGVDLVAHGWSESMTPDDWRATVNTTPAQPYTVFTVEDTELGRADTAGARTSGAFVAGTDTSLTVVSSGRPWINSTDHAAQFPFSIVAAGIELEVTAISGSTSPQVFTISTTVSAVKTIPDGSAVRLASRHTLAL